MVVYTRVYLFFILLENVRKYTCSMLDCATTVGPQVNKHVFVNDIFTPFSIEIKSRKFVEIQCYLCITTLQGLGIHTSEMIKSFLMQRCRIMLLTIKQTYNKPGYKSGHKYLQMNQHVYLDTNFTIITFHV